MAATAVAARARADLFLVLTAPARARMPHYRSSLGKIAIHDRRAAMIPVVCHELSTSA